MSNEFEDFYYRSSDGLKLHARIYGTANAATLPVVCLAGLTRLDAYETTARLRMLNPAPRVIICYVQEDAFEVQQLVQAGATGFIAKDANPGEFANAVRAVSGGGTYFPNALASALFSLQGKALGGCNVYGLSQRETEILRFLADGSSNKEVARRLGLSVRTVETHRLNIRKKTKAGTLSDLIRIAKAMRLTAAAVGDTPSRTGSRPVGQAASRVLSENAEIV